MRYLKGDLVQIIPDGQGFRFKIGQLFIIKEKDKNRIGNYYFVNDPTGVLSVCDYRFKLICRGKLGRLFYG